MTRLEFYRDRGLLWEHHGDVGRIKSALDDSNLWQARGIHAAWCKFSRAMYSSEWMKPEDNILIEFRKWLQGERN